MRLVRDNKKYNARNNKLNSKLIAALLLLGSIPMLSGCVDVKALPISTEPPVETVAPTEIVEVIEEPKPKEDNRPTIKELTDEELAEYISQLGIVDEDEILSADEVFLIIYRDKEAGIEYKFTRIFYDSKKDTYEVVNAFTKQPLFNYNIGDDYVGKTITEFEVLNPTFEGINEILIDSSAALVIHLEEDMVDGNIERIFDYIPLDTWTHQISYTTYDWGRVFVECVPDAFRETTKDLNPELEMEDQVGQSKGK